MSEQAIQVDPALGRRQGALGRAGAAGDSWLSLTLVGVGLYLFVIHSHKAAIASPAIALALVGVILQGRRVVIPTFLLWFGAWVAWGLVTLAWTDFPAESWARWVAYAKLWIIVFALANAARTPNQWLALVVIWLGLFAVFPVRGTFMNFVSGISFGGGRYSWNFSFRNPNDLAAYSLLILALAVSVFSIAPKRWLRWSALGGIMVLPLMLFATQSRGALVGTGIFGILLLAAERAKFRALAITSVVAATVLMAAPSGVWDRLSNMRHLQSVETIGEADTSAEQRWVIWQVAIALVKSHPIGGVGVGSYPKAHSNEATTTSEFAIAQGERDTHSLYLNVLAETGFIGAGVFVGLLVSVLVRIRTAERYLRNVKKDSGGARAAAALRCGLIGFLVCAIFGTLHKEPYLFLFLVITSQFAGFVLQRSESPGLAPVRNPRAA